MSLLITAGWCALHFIGFMAQRQAGILSRERMIFCYHAGSFFLLASLLVMALCRGAITTMEMVGLLSLHGIYSLSFLEVWSLAEGGYTLSLLRLLRYGPQKKDVARELLTEIGEAKRKNRLADLSKQRLIANENGAISLTAFGRVAASVILVLRAIAVTGRPG